VSFVSPALSLAKELKETDDREIVDIMSVFD